MKDTLIREIMGDLIDIVDVLKTFGDRSFPRCRFCSKSLELAERKILKKGVRNASIVNSTSVLLHLHFLVEFQFPYE